MRVWLVMESIESREHPGAEDDYPDSVWTTEEAAEARKEELLQPGHVAIAVDVYAMDVDTPDGSVDPVEGVSGRGWTGWKPQ